VRTRAKLTAKRFVQEHVEAARPAPGVAEAVAGADVVLVAPSNPVVSIGTILGIPGIREALAATSAPVVGLSPIVAGRVVRGMADACLTAIGVATSAEAVGLHYGARRDGGLLDAWLVDTADGGAVDGLTAAGIRSEAIPLLMTDDAATAVMAAHALRLADEAR
jgi:LPPG:FO 2-phospho-L-lactate transferase